MIHASRSHRIDTIFVLIIFCVFAVSVLMVLMLGASTYAKVTEMSGEGHSERSVLSYIWTKVKNSDDAGQVHVGDFHGLSALYIDEEIGQAVYRTAIYGYNGWVYELFCEAGLDFYPEDGQQIIRLDHLVFKWLESGLIRVSADARSLLIFPRGSASEADSYLAYAEGGASG